MGIVERKKREKERRRKEILEAARKVFLRHGYSAASIKEIAEVAQLSSGTIYLYFKNKEELYAALALEMLNFLLEKSNSVAGEKSTSIWDRLLTMQEIYIDMYQYDAKSLIHLFQLQSAETLTRLSPEMVDTLVDLSTRAHNDLVEILQEGMDQGILREDDPVVVADSLWGTFCGVVLWVESKRRLNHKKDFVVSTLKTAMTVFFQGLMK